MIWSSVYLLRRQLVEVALEQASFAAAGAARERPVRKAPPGHEAVEQSRIVLGDLDAAASTRPTCPIQS